MRTVALSDHPLMGAEDRLSATLHDLHASYAAHMTADAPAQCDDRLAALLALSPAEEARQATMGGQAQGWGASARKLQYDFERDSVAELCARASAVLAALSEVRGAHERGAGQP